MNARRRPTGTDVPRPWQPRFTIGTLLLVMVVVSVTAAAGSYLMRALREGGRSAQLTFILFTLAAPVVLVVVISLVRQAITWFQRRR